VELRPPSTNRLIRVLLCPSVVQNPRPISCVSWFSNIPIPSVVICVHLWLKKTSIACLAFGSGGTSPSQTQQICSIRVIPCPSVVEKPTPQLVLSAAVLVLVLAEPPTSPRISCVSCLSWFKKHKPPRQKPRESQPAANASPLTKPGSDGTSPSPQHNTTKLFHPSRSGLPQAQPLHAACQSAQSLAVSS
jgi:hypothetical protein